VLRFLEHFTGVREHNISPWRRKTFGDLTSAFRFDHADKHSPVLPDTATELSLAKYGSTSLPKPVLPGANQKFPKQEKS
jgi:phospholipase C